MSLLERPKAFLRSLLNDFAFQWRHAAYGPYNDHTFHRLAYAIIRIVNLDYTIKDLDIPRRAPGSALVRLQDLPQWDRWSGDIGSEDTLALNFIHMG
jgi:hypothetical protein